MVREGIVYCRWDILPTSNDAILTLNFRRVVYYLLQRVDPLEKPDLFVIQTLKLRDDKSNMTLTFSVELSYKRLVQDFIELFKDSSPAKEPYQ